MLTSLPCFYVSSMKGVALPLLDTTLTSPQLRMSAALDIISPTRSIVLGLISLPIFFILPTIMPPLFGSRRLQLATQSIIEPNQSRSFGLFLVVLVTAGITWMVIAYISRKKSLRRKSRIINTNVDIPEKPTPNRSLQRQDSGVCHDHWECDHNNYLNSLKQEILQQTEKPIHPWISPPQALPGPYDPMYYPLPAPSFRQKLSPSLPPNVEGRNSTPFTRLVPRLDSPRCEAVLYGTMTTSTNGWRRSHWNVTGN
jgi:hypothetical protein